MRIMRIAASPRGMLAWRITTVVSGPRPNSPLGSQIVANPRHCLQAPQKPGS